MSATARTSPSRWRGRCSTPAWCPTRSAPTCTATTPRAEAARHAGRASRHGGAPVLRQDAFLARLCDDSHAGARTDARAGRADGDQQRRRACCGMQGEIGTLRPGAAADVSRAADERGRCLLQDNEGNASESPTGCSARVSACAPGTRYDADAPILPRRAGRSGLTAYGVGAPASPQGRRRASCAAAASYVGDIRLPGMLEVAFLRSPVAHARLLNVTKPPGRETDVFIAADLRRRQPIRADSALQGLQAPRSSRRSRRGKVRQVGERSPPASPPSRAEAEDLVEQTARSDTRPCPRSSTCSARATGTRRACTRTGATTSSSKPAATTTSPQLDADRRRQGDKAAAHGPPTHGADGRPRRASCEWDPRLEQLVVHTRDADAAHQPSRARRMPRPRSGPDPRGLAGCRRRLRLQGHPAARGNRLARARVRLGRPVRWLEDRRSSSPATPTAASTITTSRSRPPRRARCSASSARRRSIPAPTPRTRSAPASRRRRSARSCPAPT